jgi:hypothetical protein
VRKGTSSGSECIEAESKCWNALSMDSEYITVLMHYRILQSLDEEA